jgi:hypothetical protein
MHALSLAKWKFESIKDTPTADSSQAKVFDGHAPKA